MFLAASAAWASGGDSALAGNLDSAQIVAEMQRHDDMSRQELKQYESLRVYRVEYRGYSQKVAATMEVEVKYDAASGKSFHIVSQSGSRFLLDKVLKRAVEGEEEASQDGEAMALTPANYQFQLAGVDTVNGRPAYILDVKPVKPAKFLYRGKIWVDAQDFAVVKIDAAPAKSPSFWIDRTEIQYSNAMTDGFWLPERIRSQTWVRIGGTAVMTIDYGTYQVVAAQPAVALASPGQ